MARTLVRCKKNYFVLVFLCWSKNHKLTVYAVSLTFVFADIMMARGIVRECVQDVDRLASVAATASQQSSSNPPPPPAPSSS